MPTKTNNESPLELTKDQMERGSATLGGATKGALIGAKLGSIVPGIGNLVGAGLGATVGGLGGFFREKKLQEEQPIQPTYTTNINAIGEEIPNKMTYKPLKQLSPYTASYSAYNMSAKQASKEPIMQKLSGVSSLQFTEEGLEKLSAANIGGEFGAIVEAEKNKIKKD